MAHDEYEKRIVQSDELGPISVAVQYDEEEDDHGVSFSFSVPRLGTISFVLKFDCEDKAWNAYESLEDKDDKVREIAMGIYEQYVERFVHEDEDE